MIEYTFPFDHTSPQLRGVTAKGGIPSTVVVDRKPVKGIMFATEIGGRRLFLRADGRPYVQALIDEYEAAQRAAADARAAALEANVPGVTEVLDAAAAAYNEDARYSSEFEAMMDDEGNDGARPPRALDASLAQRLEALTATYPRAALYLRAKRQADSASWSDNTGKGAAGTRAMEILAGGGDIAAAEAALAVRRDFVD